MMTDMTTRCTTISIIGKPNAGKSTLLNRLIGQKIAIVTPKVQTTRSIITGIFTEGNTQLVFIDTPGIFNPKKKLEKAMVRCAWSSIVGVDHVILLIDSTTGVTQEIEEILKRLEEKSINPILVFNKIDSPRSSVKSLNSRMQTFQISALDGNGVKELISYLANNAPEKPWLYDEDDVTNLPMRFLASEITREKLFLNLQEELPYNLTVETEAWENRKDGSAKINQVIIVNKPGYKSMVLGNQGQMIKKIGIQSRLDIEKELGIKAHLFLFVKVRGDWENNPENYSYLGLTLPKDH